MSWKGNEEWEQCARCGTRRPAPALADFAGRKVCADDPKWCNDLVRDRGGFEVDRAGLTAEDRAKVEREEAELAAKLIGGDK